MDSVSSDPDSFLNKVMKFGIVIKSMLGEWRGIFFKKQSLHIS